MKRTTADKTDQALAGAAGRGDDIAFAELHRRHAPRAWRLALAVAVDPDDAAAAVVDATGVAHTATRTGRDTTPFATMLLTATRNAALDRRRQRDGAVSADNGSDADPFLAGAFAGLPERWRSVLWLRDAEGVEAAETAPVVELAPDAVDQLAVRARRGLRERYLRAHVAATGVRNCARAVVRLGALEDGTLSDADQANLERHLGLCDDCTERRARLAGLTAGLSALALPFPEAIDDRAKAAWSAAIATPISATGLSPRTEKVLAGASAFAAAAGVLGATFFGIRDNGAVVAAPLAPLVAEAASPRPIDLSGIGAPIATAPTIADRPRVAVTGTSSTSTPTATDRALPATSPSGEVAAPAPAPDPSGGGDDTLAATAPSSPLPAPEVQVGTEIADTTIAVNLSDDPGITVGDTTIGSEPESGDDTLTVGGALEPIEPVVEPVNDALQTVTDGLGGLGL